MNTTNNYRIEDLQNPEIREEFLNLVKGMRNPKVNGGPAPESRDTSIVDPDRVIPTLRKREEEKNQTVIAPESKDFKITVVGITTYGGMDEFHRDVNIMSENTRMEIEERQRQNLIAYNQYKVAVGIAST